jgi:hypothetical protein
LTGTSRQPRKTSPFSAAAPTKAAFSCPATVFWVRGQKNQAGSIIRFGRQGDQGLRATFFQKKVGLLNENAGTITGGFVAAAGAPVGQVHQDRQGVCDQRMALAVVDVADHAHTAGIVLECRAV